MSDNTLFITCNDKVYCCGDNKYGQLGLGDNINRKTFVEIKQKFKLINKIITNNKFTLIICNREIYSCGCNGNGVLGLGDFTDRNIFEKIDFNFGKIINVSVTHLTIIVSNNKNNVFVCGWNGTGQLATNDLENLNKFKKIKYEFGEIKSIYSTMNSIAILNTLNDIYICGRNVINGGPIDFVDKIIKINYSGYSNILEFYPNYYSSYILNDKHELFYYYCKNMVHPVFLNSSPNIVTKIENFTQTIKKILYASDISIFILTDKNEIYFCSKSSNIDIDIFTKINYNFNNPVKIINYRNNFVLLSENNKIFTLCKSNENYEFTDVNYNFGIIKEIKHITNILVIINEDNKIYIFGDSDLLKLESDIFLYENINLGDIQNNIYIDENNLIII